MDEDDNGSVDKAELYSSSKVAKVPGAAELLLGTPAAAPATTTKCDRPTRDEVYSELPQSDKQQ